MKAAGRAGSIINVASILGLRQGGMVLPYAVSKAGAIQMTKLSALELARYGIRVNAIAPGHIPTELNASVMADPQWVQQNISRYPVGRFGKIEDLDTAILFLASPHSGFVTGIALPVDGGWTSR